MEQLGPYTNLEKIGEGGMGVTYRAWQDSLNRHVAIKMLKEGADQKGLDRFRREGKAIASMDKHGSIVQVHDAHLDEPPYYLVLEFLQGRSLASLLAQNGRLPKEQAVHLIAQVLRGLDHAHSHGIIHRDIKPDNIMVNEAGKATITDFGIAQVNSETRMTAEGMTVGTADYMSPEQARGSPIDERTDLYSAGVVLYEMLTGRTPFAGGGVLTVMNRITNDVPPAPSGFYPDIPPALETVVLRALKKDPRERFQSATEMLRDVEAALREPETSTSPHPYPPKPEPDGPPPPPPPAPKRWLPAVGLVVVLVLIGSVLFAMMHGRSGRIIPPPSFRCDVPGCGLVFTSSEKLAEHKKTHHATPPTIYQCKFCNKSFPTQSELDAHVKKAHPSQPMYKCPQCGAMFASQAELNSHIRSSHQPRPRYECPQCGATFASQADLNSHMRSMHRSQPTYKCPQCGATFTSQADLNSHMRSMHRSQPTYKCPQCGATFNTQSQLDAHMRDAHSPKYTCTKCGATFSTQSELDAHIRDAHSPKYTCTKCGATFGTQSELDAHMRDAHSPAQYKCKYCGKTFSTEKECKKHEKTCEKNPLVGIVIKGLGGLLRK